MSNAGRVTSASGTLGELAIAWGGTEGALAYVRLPVSEVFLRRFDAAGQLLGSEVSLGSTFETGNPRISLASDAGHHVACFNAGGAVQAFRCASVAVGMDVSVNGIQVNGEIDPSVAAGPVGFLLVYPGRTLTLQFLDGQAAAMGQPTTFGNATTFATVAGSPDNYAIAFERAGALSAVHVAPPGFITAALYTLAEAGHFSTTLPPTLVSVGAGFGAVWFDASLAGGAVVAATTGPLLRSEDVVNSSAQTYGKTSAATGLDSMVATWSGRGGSFMYQALDNRSVALPGSSAVPVLSQDWDDNRHAIVGVPDGFMFAGEVGSTPGSTFDAIQLVHLGCP